LNKKEIFICILNIFFISLFSCSEKIPISLDGGSTIWDRNEKDAILDGGKMNNKDIIIKLIRNVPQEVGLTIVWDFKSSNSFLELEECSSNLLDIAIELLESDELNSIEKQIITYAIQDVDFGKFKFFLRDLAISFVNGKIDECFVSYCFFPEDWSYRVIENYKDPIIREAFNICLKSSRTSSSLKRYIKLAKRGKLWKNVQEHLIMVQP